MMMMMMKQFSITTASDVQPTMIIWFLSRNSQSTKKMRI